MAGYNLNVPSNPSEKLLWDKLINEGWHVLQKGWPDFFCFRQGENGKIMLVEVKGRHKQRLKKEQLWILVRLAKLGVPCYRWSPDLGLQQITAQMTDSEDI